MWGIALKAICLVKFSEETFLLFIIAIDCSTISSIGAFPAPEVD